MKRFAVLYSIILVLLIVCSLLPFLTAISSGTVAEAFGCKVDEGSAHPCIVFGLDLGEVFYGMGVLGWLGLITIPLGGIVILIYLIGGLVGLVVWQSRKGKNSDRIIQTT